jgi:predicted MFS family arabinose efflux permease
VNSAAQDRGMVRSRLLLVIVAASVIISAAMGARQTFGLFLSPLAIEHGLPVGTIALAIALHNLVWGLAQPLAGAAADRWGAAPIVGVGALAYAAGLAVAATTTSGLVLVLGMGVLVGIGMSGTTFGVVLSAVGRAASPRQRSLAMGLASAGGSLGQITLAPVAQFSIEGWGVSASLLGLALLLILAGPFGLLLDRRTAPPTTVAELRTPPLGEILTQALRHPGYRLLTLGFFTCGFQLAFISTYLPDYLTLCHMPMGLSAKALSLIGLFNMIGSWACGWLGGRMRQQTVLGWLYLIRGVAIAAFFLLPKSPASVVVFAAVMGLTWLGTVPLTSGWVAKVFGTGHLGTLFGVCFFSHQIGSFLGAWLGGFVFDLTGSYAAVWILTAAAGAMAALLHFPIKDAAPATMPPAVRA